MPFRLHTGLLVLRATVCGLAVIRSSSAWRLAEVRGSRNLAHIESEIAQRLDASPGLRHEPYSSFSGVTDPRLALVQPPLEELGAKVIYGQAFRAPNDCELYHKDGASPNSSPWWSIPAMASS